MSGQKEQVSSEILVPDQIFEQEQAEALRRAIESVPITALSSSIRVNFKDCRALSAYALGLLAQLHENLEPHGGGLLITGLKTELREILDVISYDRLIPIEDR